MKKTFTLLAIAAFASNVSSQVISQNATPSVVSTTGSVACGSQANGYTSDNYYSRAFNLADYAINYDYKITNVAIGVQTANKGFNVNVNLYSLTGNYPGGATTLLNSVPIAVTPESVGTMVDTGTSLTQIIPASLKFVLEVFHDGETNVEQFYLGTNPGAQTGPSYLKSEACAILTPIATGTGALANFGSARWVMTVTGVNNLGVTEIINSKNLQVFPNPVKDVLNFRMANNLKVESIELYDMTGKKVNTINAKATDGLNVSNFSKGIYILKVKGSDGVVYVQKILKD